MKAEEHAVLWKDGAENVLDYYLPLYYHKLKIIVIWR